MDKITEFIGRNWKWMLVVIVLTIIYFTARKNWYRIKFWFQPRDIDVEEGEVTNLSAEKEKELKDLARLIYTDIYDTPYTGHDYDLYARALALSDTELLYMARFYRKSLTRGITMYDDLNNELFITNIDTQLKSRLSKIGEGAKGDSRIAARTLTIPSTNM